MISQIFAFDESLRNIRTDHLNFQQGFVFDRLVTIRRDTGCTTVVVNKGLVPQAAFTGRQQKFIMTDGTIGEAERAKVFVKSLLFTGVVKALCLNLPVCDLIIGNINDSHSKELEQQKFNNVYVNLV